MSALISEYAYGIGDLVDLLEPRVREDLAQLLINHDGLPTAGRERSERIALLVHLVWSSPGVPVRRIDYDAVQADRIQKGEEWPTSTELISAYGSWEHAHSMADLLLKGDRRGVGSRAYPFKNRNNAYSPADVIACIREAHDFYGYWPIAEEYRRWAKIKREAERTSGKENPEHVPALRVVFSHFGSWQHAVEVAAST